MPIFEIDMERCLKDSKEMWETTPKSATYTKYEAKKEFISVFDANGLSPRTPIANDMAVISVPLNELKAEKCLRISAEDLLIYLSKNEVLPLDIRQPQDYSRGSLSESINLPFSNCFDKSTEEITKIPTEVRATKKIVLVISGGRGHMAACLVASALLKAGVARVCTLHKGIDSLRNSNALVLPS
ncbi:TBC domain-containing protein kinase-like protein isoform X1 [Artemia franciscana]|uniref:TBC domain-containing protein kinase-like protein isoform X1 n=1 Tax=Artemia franciscana TaxID=6661 RepID=UPI0032DAAC2F